MVDERQQLLCSHYQQLSEEIAAADTRNYQLIGVVIAAVVALLAAAFGKPPEDQCWILMSVYAVTIPGRFLFEAGRARIWRVASYLEIFVEPELQLVKWQERLNKRSNFQNLRTNVIRTEGWLISGLDVVAGLLVIATALGIKNQRTSIAFVAGAIVFMLHSLIQGSLTHGRFDRKGTVHRANQESWRALKKLEDELGSRPSSGNE
jgi:hypothetical protein